MTGKQFAALVVLAFLVYWAVTEPQMAGNAVGDFFGVLKDGADAAIAFMRSLSL